MIFNKKKYGVMFHNLRCNYCGTDYFTPQLPLIIKLLLTGEIYQRCNHCGKYSRYTLQYHVTHDVVKSKELEYNKKHDDRRLKP